MNNKDDINITLKYVNKIYDGLSYYDLYGGSVIIFFLITMFVFLVWSYCNIMQTKGAIADDWVNQRCKPSNIPFAGLINKPDHKTVLEYTEENFQFCLNSVLVDITGALVEPTTFLIDLTQESFNMIDEAVNIIRNFVNIIRLRIASFATEVLGRIANMIVPFQAIIIAVRDTFLKAQASLVAGLYTALGSYLVMKSFLSAIIENIFTIMATAALIIIALWAAVLTAPVAQSLMIIYVVVAIYVTLIIVFLRDVMHIHSKSIPKVRCFDKHTILTMDDGLDKEIQDIVAGDVLKDGIRVTAKIRVDAKDLRMFNLNNIIVSESHIVNYRNKWLPIREHPDAIEIFNYKESELFCLNTVTKEIIINDIKFTDWDEIYDTSLQTIIRHISGKLNYVENIIENIDDALFEGFTREIKIDLVNNNNKTIDEIVIGDKLVNGGIVYGIVELYKNNLGNNKDTMFHLLVSNGQFRIEGEIYQDYNYRIDSILK
jgi:hypothetical protein